MSDSKRLKRAYSQGRKRDAFAMLPDVLAMLREARAENEQLRQEKADLDAYWVDVCQSRDAEIDYLERRIRQAAPIMRSHGCWREAEKEYGEHEGP